jgi:hypothetical protein
MGLVLRTNHNNLPVGATVSKDLLSIEQMDENFIFLQNNVSVNIPEPQIHLNGNDLAYTHMNNNYVGEQIRSSTVSNTFHETINGISLYWRGTDTNFMNYDPHFFLFQFTKGGVHKKSRHHPYSSARKRRSFKHPHNSIGAMFSNFSGGTSSNSRGMTEWPVINSNHLVNLELNPHDYYEIDDFGGDYTQNRFFPRTLVDWDSQIYLKGGFKSSSLKPKTPKKIVLSFAIVIRNPKDPNKYIIGPMSKTIIITPKLSTFSIPSEYISNEKIAKPFDGQLLAIPNNPDWTIHPQSTINIFFGWKAYIK